MQNKQYLTFQKTKLRENKCKTQLMHHLDMQIRDRKNRKKIELDFNKNSQFLPFYDGPSEKEIEKRNKIQLEKMTELKQCLDIQLKERFKRK